MKSHGRDMHFELLKTLAQDGPLTVVVSGDCMQQAIAEGSRLRLENDRTYWPGDVIAFRRRDDKIVSHRLLGYAPSRDGWRVVTRADAARLADRPVLVREVLGKVTAVNDTPFKPRDGERADAMLQYGVSAVRWLLGRLGSKLR